MATWGSMLKAPGNIVSGVGSGIMKAVKYTIIGAVVVGFAVGLGELAKIGFGGSTNYVADAVNSITKTLGPYFESAVNGIWHFFSPYSNIISPSKDAAQALLTSAETAARGTGEAARIASAALPGLRDTVAAASTNTVGGFFADTTKMIGEWAQSIMGLDPKKIVVDSSRAIVGSGTATGGTLDPAVAGNVLLTPLKKATAAAIAVGGAGLATGTVVGKWTEKEAQRSDARARALQQLG